MPSSRHSSSSSRASSASSSSSSAGVTVYIAMYRPTDQRDPSHWAIFLNGGGNNDVILQVGDDKHGRGYYVDRPMMGKQPQRSSMWRESIPAGSVNAADLRSVIATICNTPVDNRSNTWNCQAWCVEALDNMQGHFGFRWSARARALVLSKRQNWQ